MGKDSDYLPQSHATFEVAGVLVRKKIAYYTDRDKVAVLRGSIAVKVNDDIVETRLYIREFLNNIRNKKYDEALSTLKNIHQGDDITISGRYCPATYWSKAEKRVIIGQPQFHADFFSVPVLYDPYAIVKMDYYPRTQTAQAVDGFVMTMRGLEPTKLQTAYYMDCNSIYSVEANITSSQRGYVLTAYSLSKTSKQYSAETFNEEIDKYESRIMEITERRGGSGHALRDDDDSGDRASGGTD